MRRLTGLEWGIFVLGLLFLFIGAAMVVHPTELNVEHLGYRNRTHSIEHVSTAGTRVYGILSAFFGLGFLWLVLSKRDK